MRSPRARGARPGLGTAVWALLSLWRERRRTEPPATARPQPAAVAVPPLGPTGPRPGRVAALGLLLAAIVSALVGGGYRLKHAREQREAAVQLTGGDPERG